MGSVCLLIGWEEDVGCVISCVHSWLCKETVWGRVEIPPIVPSFPQPAQTRSAFGDELSIPAWPGWVSQSRWHFPQSRPSKARPASVPVWLPSLAMEDERFEVPENVKVITNASHAQIFPHAACVVTHAGHGTVMRALANGVSLVCLPMGRDQNDNAAKIVLYNAGLGLSPKSSPNKIAKAVRKVLETPSFHDHAKKLGEQIVADAQNGNLVSSLETIANYHSAAPRRSDDSL